MSLVINKQQFKINMRRKIKAIDPKELFDADDINRTTIKGEMRKLYPAIHQKLSECSWSARDMVQWLDERGVSMSVELFRVYLNNLDHENGYVRSSRQFNKEEKMTNAQSGSPAGKFGGLNPPPAKPTAPPPSSLPSDGKRKERKVGGLENKKPSTDELRSFIRNPTDLSEY